MTPFCKTDGLYFNSKSEPNGFAYRYGKDINDELRSQGYIVIGNDEEDKAEYIADKMAELRKNVVESYDLREGCSFIDIVTDDNII